MTIKISQLTNLTVVQANTIVPVVSNITGTLTTVQANVQQLQNYIIANGVSANITALYANAATQSDLIIGINSNVTQANLGMKGYVDSISGSESIANVNMKGYVDGQITAANTGVTAANIGIIGYIGLSNTSMKGYVDGQVTAANAAVTAANAAIIFANTSMKSYVDGQVTAANAGVTSANVGMKGYVDSQTYSNVQTLAFFITNLPTYQGNIGVNVNVTNGTLTASSFVGNGSQLTGIAYTMGNVAHWTSNVTTISAALDQLAQRIYNIENP